MWFGIWILSVVLSVILIPIGILFGILVKIYQNKFFKEGLPMINQKFKRLATGLDIFGNVAAPELFDYCLLTKDSNNRFGDYGETISSVIGKNKIRNTLSKTGIYLDKILDILDKNHSIKSIKDDIK